MRIAEHSVLGLTFGGTSLQAKSRLNPGRFNGRSAQQLKDRGNADSSNLVPNGLIV
jgi:hypothetical protein